MSKVKKFAFSGLVIFVIWGVFSAHSQEAAPPSDIVKNDVNVVEEKTPFVKPGNVTVNFKDADIRAVLNYLSEVGGVDVVPAPDVSGPITLKLTDKPWETALEIIVKNYGYAYEREGDIIRVVTISSLKLEELSTEVIPLNYTTAEDAQEAVKDMLTERGKLTYDARVNSLVVTDLATNIYKIKQVVKSLDRKTPQIMIEAKIIETTLGKDEKLGINWNIVIAASGAQRPTTLPFTNWGDFPGIPDLRKFYPFGQTTGTTATTGSGGSSAVSQTTPGGFPASPAGTPAFPFGMADQFSYGTLDFSQFRAVLEYLNSRLDTDIVSSPRITTLNNKAAKMFVGKVYNYISEIEQKEDTGGQERWTYEIEKEEIGIRLLVTPHINDNGDIEVELKPEIKDVIGFQQVTQFFSLPIFTTREAETRVMVRDADTIFIGGLIKENIKRYDKKFPLFGDLFGDIPFVGPLFKYKSEEKEKTELIFFLTVHVVKDLRELKKFATKDIVELKVMLEEDEAALESLKEDRGELVTEMRDFAPVKKESRAFLDFRKNKE